MIDSDAPEVDQEDAEPSTEHRVEVVRLGAVLKHPNADTLSYSMVHGGYPVIFRTGDYHEGDLAVYAPVESVVPADDHRWGFLKSPRIKAARIRGLFSMGLLTPAPDGTTEGQEVSGLLGIRQYQPPAPKYNARGSQGGIQGAQLCETDHGYMPKYTSLEPIRRNRNVIGPDEIVCCTEKIHGANARYAFRDGRLWVGSRTTIKKDLPNSDWWNAAKRYDLATKLDDPRFAGLVFYGEVFGKVQDLNYGQSNGVDLAIFDIAGHDGLYLNHDDVVVICAQLELKRAPELYRGRFDEIPPDLSEGESMLGGNVREGYVVKPVVERYDPRVGRVILKFHGEGYLTRGDKRHCDSKAALVAKNAAHKERMREATSKFGEMQSSATASGAEPIGQYRVMGSVACPYCDKTNMLVFEVIDPDVQPQARVYGPATAECCGRLFSCQMGGHVEVYVLDSEAASVAPDV